MARMLSASRRGRLPAEISAICADISRLLVQEGGEFRSLERLACHVWKADLTGARELSGELSQGSEATKTKTNAAARKRAAVEMIARYEGALRRTARRYSFDAEDADDAYQRALEIVLTKAPTTDLRELIRWTQTVTKHEALAVRRSREKLLGYQRDREGAEDPVALIPAAGDGPEAQVERREDVARSREALQALKPAELRALGLLAEGYSYVEIGERTGWSQTNVYRQVLPSRPPWASPPRSPRSRGSSRPPGPCSPTGMRRRPALRAGAPSARSQAGAVCPPRSARRSQRTAP
jgi:RNA polymerase sigma factor (sigma-70 family)